MFSFLKLSKTMLLESTHKNL